MSNENPAEVLAEMLASAKEENHLSYSETARFAARLSRSLAAGKVAGWAIVDNRGCESRCGLVLQDYFGAVMEAEPPTAEHVAKLDSEYPGLAPHRLVTLYTAPPADPAKASEPEYDRSLIADMLDDLSTLGSQYTYDAIRKQMDLLNAADNADAAKVRTVRSSGSAPDASRAIDAYNAAVIEELRIPNILATRIAMTEAMQSQPASAPEVTAQQFSECQAPDGTLSAYENGWNAALHDVRPLIEQCRKALAEELAAYDIDPPIEHVKQAHDKCVEFLTAALQEPRHD